MTRLLRLAGMPIVSPEMVLIPDEELQQLAEEKGPASAEAQALAQLKTQRAQDLQVHCFRILEIAMLPARCRRRASRREPMSWSMH